MKLRPFRAEDGAAALDIFRTAVRELGPSAYSEDQVMAWARFADESQAFLRRLAEGDARVIEVDGVVGAFGQLHPNDHVEMIYCHPAFVCRGYAGALLYELEHLAQSRGARIMTTDSSLVALPFFRRRGYVTMAVERVTCFGVDLARHRMQKIFVAEADDGSGQNTGPRKVL